MTIEELRDRLEGRQVGIYFGAVLFGVVAALLIPGTTGWHSAINPALALMLFVTFLQVPFAELRQAFGKLRFLGALLVTNFVIVPLLVAILIQLAPADLMIRLGLLLVLLCPCIDYVVTFSHLGRSDAPLLLASTPALLIVQMLLLPLYLGLFLGADASRLVQSGPFVQAFIWLIAAPLTLAVLAQLGTERSASGRKASALLGLLPVPATALVLFIVIAAVVPQLGQATAAALQVAPLYVAFAVIAPLLGWGVSRLTNLDAEAGRALAFSSATRNSLVVLPLALAVPGAVPLLPAVIVTQTLIELIAELIYIRAFPRLGMAK
jgi:ACR3 family arsenite efflux pump ArsB